MAPESRSVVLATQAWLQSSWHVQVPFAWLEACVEWLQEEAGGAGRLSPQQINQQALDQWLLTDLRDLDHPVLPEGLAQAQKTELSGTFCIQVDSLLDIGQPAYGQLQKLRGTDCTNDEVSDVTQATQRPWEARPTRVLLLQVTDGVQSLEAMEYQFIPALSAALRPGVKLQLRGQMVCRLGVLLLGPSNIKVLGGEVEDLVDRNHQGRVLCRTLGLPEEVQQQEEEGEEAPPAPQQGHQEEQDLEFDDAELLASLEAQEELERVPLRPGQDSGYGTHSETSMQSSESASVRRPVSTASFRSEQEDSNHLSSDHLVQPELSDHNMADDDFPDEDFEALPLDELDAVIFQESPHFTDGSLGSMPQSAAAVTVNLNRATKPQTGHSEQRTSRSSGSQPGSSDSGSTLQKRDYGGWSGRVEGPLAAAVSSPSFSTLESSRELEFEGFATSNESNFTDQDMDCLSGETVQTLKTGGPNQPPVPSRPSGDRESITKKTGTPGSSGGLARDPSRWDTPQRQSYASNQSAAGDQRCRSTAPALTLTSPPFTYLCVLAETTSRSNVRATEIRVKAFIVTLLGKLSANGGLWRVCATISDGTGYLDVELSNDVLTGLLGFSVAEKGTMKRDPARRAELDAGMRRCQEELVDMCCVMTVVVEPEGRRAAVTKAEPVSEEVLRELEQRVRDWRKGK